MNQFDVIRAEVFFPRTLEVFEIGDLAGRFGVDEKKRITRITYSGNQITVYAGSLGGGYEAVGAVVGAPVIVSWGNVESVWNKKKLYSQFHSDWCGGGVARLKKITVTFQNGEKAMYELGQPHFDESKAAQFRLVKIEPSDQRCGPVFWLRYSDLKNKNEDAAIIDEINFAVGLAENHRGEFTARFGDTTDDVVCDLPVTE